MKLGNLVLGFVGFVFVCIVSYWIVVGILVFRGIEIVRKEGIKPFITRIWEGQK